MKLSRRELLAATSSLVFLNPAQAKVPRDSIISNSTSRTAKTGAGGQVTAQCINGTTRLCRTDVGGIWKQNPTTHMWRQVMNTHSIPSSALGNNKWMGGGYEVLIAPNDTNRVYIIFANENGGEGAAYCLVSNDAGETFANPGTFVAVAGVLSANIFTYKFHGPKGGVDPNNRDVVYVGTPHNGAAVSSDGGLTWALVPNVPASTTGAPEVGFLFDTNSNTTSSGLLAGNTSVPRTSKIYICTQGGGVYQSVDGGLSFSAMPASPSTARHARLSSTGVLYIANPSTLHRYRNSTWTRITPPIDGNGVETIAMTSVATTIVAAAPTGQLFWSADEGDHWTSLQRASTLDSSATIPWLSYPRGTAATGNFMSIGEIIEDPNAPGTLIGGYGIGIAKTTSVSGSASTAWLDDSVGIEELVTNQIISPPGFSPISAFWDRAVFRYPDSTVYPSIYGPDGPNFSAVIEFGWSVAYSVSSPIVSHLLAQTLQGKEVSAYSNDNGQNWTLYANFPALSSNGWIGGSITSSSPDHVVLAAAQGGPIFYSRNARSTSATWIPLLKSSFSNGATASCVMTDAQSLPITGVGAGAATGLGGNKVRFTLAGGVGTLVTGSYCQFQSATVAPFTAATGDLAGISFGTFVVEVIDGTHVDLDGTTFVKGVLGSGPRLVGQPGWGAFARYVRKRSVVAYQATAEKYMAVNSNPSAQGGGIYVSTDGGASWTRKSTFNGNVGGNQLEAVLGKNHFFHGGGFTGGRLYYNRNDGLTWNAVTCNQGIISDVWAVSTGKAKSGNDYPSVYIYGSIGGEFGVWQSDNSDSNWSTMTAIAFKKLALPKDFWGTPAHICGDANTYGRVFVGSIANGLIEFNQ